MPEQAAIIHEAPTELNVALAPFYVRNETKEGAIDVSLERDGETLMVDYGLSDADGRNRKYRVSLSIQDAEGNETPIDEAAIRCSGDSPASCVGKGIRPGDGSFSWAMDYPDGSMPVLTLSRKKMCWPCVLIPAAAGVAAAYIFPRTGSGSSGPPLPPPRPDDLSTRP
jgi:hypothetical protein